MLNKRPGSTPDTMAVTFELPEEIWAQTIHLVGDFNGWNRYSHPLVHNASGHWQIVLELKRGMSYQYRYLVDGNDWRNDCNADDYVLNSFGGYNSVVKT